MDLRRELEETPESVVASNEQMAWDIIKDLEPINEGLQELNRHLEINEVKRKPPRESMRKRESMDHSIRMSRWFGIHYEDGHPRIETNSSTLLVTILL